MFKIFHLLDWHGVGGSRTLRIASDGIEAVRKREKLGLPVNSTGWIAINIDEVVDRRAAEFWPEALNEDADLPGVTCGHIRQGHGWPELPCELADMYKSGVVIPVGPETIEKPNQKNEVALRLKLAVSPFELVQWRRAWAADQVAAKLQKVLEELEKQIGEQS